MSSDATNSRCGGCCYEDAGKKIVLGCGHSIHVGIAERVHQITTVNPYFQIGKDFACARTLQRTTDLRVPDNEEDPSGRLICPVCACPLSNLECAKVLDRSSYLTYGKQRRASESLRRAVANLAAAWSPAHARDFDIKTEPETAPPPDIVTAGSKKKLDSKMTGLGKIKELIAFYKQNPHPKMGEILFEAVFDANLKDEEQHIALDLIDKLMEGKDDEDSGKKARVGGGAGVGYGGNESVVLSTAASDREKLRNQNLEIDAKVSEAMSNLVQVLNANDEKQFGAATEALLRKEWGVLSCLAEHLRNGNLQDIVVRHKVFTLVLDVCCQLAKMPMLVPILLSSRPLRDRVIKWSPEAAVALARTKASVHQNGNGLSSSTSPNLKERSEVEGPSLVESIQSLRSVFEASSTDPIEKALFSQCEQVLSLVEHTRKLHPHFENGLSQEEIIKAAMEVCASADATHAELTRAYKNVMGKYAFRAVDFAAMSIPHHFLSDPGEVKDTPPPSKPGIIASAAASVVHTFTKAAVAPVNKERAMAIKNTLANLRSSCPVEWFSSVFCLVDETKSTILSFLIIGPDGTPYQNGCFHFDMFLPPTFPSDPPKAIFLTTGGGKVRFNPNLYADGKICLSLLGTWAGPRWNSKESTVLQVLLSIQSLIFCTDPYFNEPGYEASRGTPDGNMRSLKYNQDIILQTLRLAIVEIWDKPPKGFEEVVRDHFRLKAQAILQQCDEWQKLYTGPQLSAFLGLVTTFKEKVGALSAPQSSLGELTACMTTTNQNEAPPSCSSSSSASNHHDKDQMLDVT